MQCCCARLLWQIRHHLDSGVSAPGSADLAELRLEKLLQALPIPARGRVVQLNFERCQRLQ
jgi:hypothetical protein